MPRYNIYIRNEDEAKWKAIENKPEWLHEHLNPKELHFTRYTKEPKSPDIEMELIAKSISIPNKVANRKLCQHAQVKGECLVKGCK